MGAWTVFVWYYHSLHLYLQITSKRRSFSIVFLSRLHRKVRLWKRWTAVWAFNSVLYVMEQRHRRNQVQILKLPTKNPPDLLAQRQRSWSAVCQRINRLPAEKIQRRQRCGVPSHFTRLQPTSSSLPGKTRGKSNHQPSGPRSRFQ